jgi:hypothetical protein
VLLGGAVAGCPGPVADEEPGGMDPRWVSLFDGTGTGRWAVLKGRAEASDGAMVLNPRGGKTTTALARGLSLKDGEVEVEVLRAEGAGNRGPYTICLRLAARLLDWSAIYFVCRPHQLEVCRGSSAGRFPSPEHVVPIPVPRRLETWRFVLRGGQIECYRFGRKLLTYSDARPRSGTVGITADGCQVAVRAVRYRRPPPQPRERPQ